MKAEAELNEKLLLALTPMNVTSVGTTYVRWGRTECPETAELVYHGKVLYIMFIIIIQYLRMK